MLFFFHRYAPRSFNPFNYKANTEVILSIKKGDWLRANREGSLHLVSSYWGKCALALQNILSFGSLHKRLERSIYFNFLAMSVEFLNPTNRNVLEIYIKRKLALFERVLKKLDRVNERKFDKRPILYNMKQFERDSLLQAHLIEQIKKAVRRQGEPQIIQLAKAGLDSGLFPVLIQKGVSGAYWMRSKEREVLGLFKPFDEEPYAINSPTKRGEQAPLGRRKMRAGVAVGEGAHNEVAAFQIDSFLGFGVVPKTYYACFTHEAFHSIRENRLENLKQKKKYGSFQQFIQGFVPFSRLDRELIRDIPLDEYQTVLFLDLLIGNSDRHFNNLLVGDGKLAAIDHGYCFPDLPPSMGMALWDVLPQANEIFHAGFKKLANNFPMDELSWKLRKNCFRSVKSMQRMRERLALFRAAVNADLRAREMVWLFSVENFCRLADLGDSLDEKAREIVEGYIPQKEELSKSSLLERWLLGYS